MIHPAIIAQQIEGARSQHQHRVALLCQVVDEFCPRPQTEAKRSPSRPVTFSDNIILKMDMLGRLSGIKDETELLRHLERHYSNMFPQLPDLSRLWRLLHRLMPKLEAFRQYLRFKLGS